MADKLDFTTRTDCTAWPYGWQISGPVGNELAVRIRNGTTQQLAGIKNDADLTARIKVVENHTAKT